uniref:Uncharacterized protein n=1 Tax=Ditylenchus dipsaci TaxID=166011 RepID=A0A915CTL9_9BILA
MRFGTNSTQSANGLPPAPARVVPTTPLQNGQPANVSSNMMTVTRTRTRQKTITVESQTSKEVEAAFEKLNK